MSNYSARLNRNPTPVSRAGTILDRHCSTSSTAGIQRLPTISPTTGRTNAFWNAFSSLAAFSLKPLGCRTSTAHRDALGRLRPHHRWQQLRCYRSDGCRAPGDSVRNGNGQQHNAVPHSSLNGQTPNELYAGTEDDVVVELMKAREKASSERIATNRAAHGPSCPKAA
jgi:hypothetical protein